MQARHMLIVHCRNKHHDSEQFQIDQYKYTMQLCVQQSPRHHNLSCVLV